MRAFLLSLSLVACSGGAGGTDAPPGGADAPRTADAAPRVDALPEPGGGCAPEVQVGRFTIEPRSVSGSVQSRPQPDRFLALEASSGACQLWSASPSFCDPACVTPQECEDGACVDPPVALSVGDVQVTAPGGTIDAAPTVPGGTYYFGSSKTELYGVGDAIHLAATGEGAIGAFAADVVGHEALERTTEQLVLTEGVGLTMTWTPSTAPGARVVLHMDSDHHGAPGFIECEADDAAGTFVVDAALGDRLIEIGATGIGTYVENAYVVRDHRTQVDTSAGCVEVAATRQDWVTVETVLAD